MNLFQIGENRDVVPVKTLKDFEYQDYVKLKAECKRTGQPFLDPEFNPDDPNYDLIGRVDLFSMRNQFPRWNQKFVWKRPSVSYPNLSFMIQSFILA